MPKACDASQTAKGLEGKRHGSEEAHELAVQTCFGSASLLIESGRHPEQEIDRVTTPSGCTIEGLNEMEHQGLSSALIQGIVASFEKINQLKKN